MNRRILIARRFEALRILFLDVQFNLRSITYPSLTLIENFKREKVSQMKIIQVIGMSALLAGCQGDLDRGVGPDDRLDTRPGLTTEGVVELERLLALQTNPQQFQSAIEELIQRREKQTLFILTHAMFELPFDSNSIRHQRTSPILIVERALDNLVFAEDSHDHLSALYFRALNGGGDLESAKAALLDWTIENENELVFFGNQLSFPDLIEQMKLERQAD